MKKNKLGFFGERNREKRSNFLSQMIAGGNFESKIPTLRRSIWDQNQKPRKTQMIQGGKLTSVESLAFKNRGYTAKYLPRGVIRR